MRRMSRVRECYQCRRRIASMKQMEGLTVDAKGETEKRQALKLDRGSRACAHSENPREFSLAARKSCTSAARREGKQHAARRLFVLLPRGAG